MSLNAVIIAIVEDLPKKVLIWVSAISIFACGMLTSSVLSLRADRMTRLEQANDSADRKERADILQQLAEQGAKNKQQDEILATIQKDSQSGQERFNTRMDTAIGQLAAMRAQLDMLSRREPK